MILIGIIAVFTVCVPAMGEESPNIEWQRCIGDTGITSCSKIIMTADNGVLIIGNEIMKIYQNGTLAWKRTADVRDVYQDESGSIFLCGSSQDDLWIEKIDLNGEILWSKLYDGSGNAEKDYAQKIMPTSDGNFIIQGYSGYTACSWDMLYNYHCYTAYSPWSIKIDNSGNIVWDINYGGDLVQAPNGDFLFINNYLGNNARYFTITKIDNEGTYQWTNTYGGSGDDWEVSASTFLALPDGEYVLAAATRSNDGQVSGNHGDVDIWIAQLDSQGNLTGQQCYGGALTDYPIRLYPVSDGEFEVVGFSDSTDYDLAGIKTTEGRLLWVFRINSQGTITRNKVYQIGEIADDIRLDDGAYYLFSSMTDPSDSSGQYDFSLTHILADGTLDWQKFYGGSGYDRATSFAQRNDGFFYIAGTTTSNDGDVGWYHGGGQNDVWIAKLSDRQNPLPLLISSTPDYENSLKGDPVIISALGTGFSSNAQISLIHEEGASVYAASVTDVSQDELSASFNLEGMPGGFYDIALTNPDGGSSSLNSVFRYIYVEDIDSKWNKEIISGIIAIGGSRGPSIAVDNENNPHIAFTLDQKILNYTHKVGSVWENETIRIAQDGVTLHDPTIAIDSNQQPHIIFYENPGSTPFHLYHAYKGPSGWTSEQIDTVLRYSNLVCGPGNTLHLCYNNNNNFVYYSYFDGSTWHSEKVRDTGVIERMSIAIDSLGDPKIVVMDNGPWSSLEYYYCQKLDGSWVNQQIPFPSGMGSQINGFVLDSNDKPYVLRSTCWDGCRLYLAELDGANWRVYLIHNNGHGGPLRIDSQGNPVAMLVSNDPITQKQKLQILSFSDNVWDITTVDEDVSGPYLEDLVLDQEDTPHIVYSSSSPMMLKYATTAKNEEKPINSDFTVSVASGPAPLQVTFYDHSDGKPESWFWEFGDGETSNLQNPSHTYNEIGEYSVNLTISKNGQESKTTKTQYIFVAHDVTGDYLRIEQAIQWALNYIGPADEYANYPLKFINSAYNNGSNAQIDIGIETYDDLVSAISRLNTNTVPPRGSYVFYSESPSPAFALSLGNGEIIHVNGEMVVTTQYLDHPGYAGWAWPPISAPIILYPLNGSVVNETPEIVLKNSIWTDRDSSEQYEIVVDEIELPAQELLKSSRSNVNLLQQGSISSINQASLIDSFTGIWRAVTGSLSEGSKKFSIFRIDKYGERISETQVVVTVKSEESNQPLFEAPWIGEAIITQGNGGSHSHIDPDSYYALDISINDESFEVLCPADGWIVESKDNGKWGEGNFIIIKHNSTSADYYTWYLHLKERKKNVSHGFVKKGELIGISGETGGWDHPIKGIHLHFALTDAYSPELYDSSYNIISKPFERIRLKDITSGDEDFKEYNAAKNQLLDGAIGDHKILSDNKLYEPIIRYNPEKPMVGGNIEFDLMNFDYNKFDEYEWDFNDGKLLVAPVPSHVFLEARKYQIRVFGIKNGEKILLANRELDLSLEPGDILFERGSGGCIPFNLLVPGEWTHSAMYIGNNKIVHSTNPVKISQISEWAYPHLSYVQVVRVRTTPEIKQKAIEFALQQADKKAGFDWKWLTKDENGDTWYCSELIWAAYKKASNGEIDFDNSKKNFNGIAPDEIANSPLVEFVGHHIEKRPGDLGISLGVIALCPVNLEIIDPDGFIINNSINQIPFSEYFLYDLNGDSIEDKIIIINYPKVGSYSLSVIPVDGADLNDTYSIYSVLDHYNLENATALAENIKVQDIPNTPYYIVSNVKIQSSFKIVEDPYDSSQYNRTFSDTSTGNIISSFWSFGDGSLAENLTEVTHTYTQPGNYTVTLTVSGPDGEDTASQVIEVLPVSVQTFNITASSSSGGIISPSGTIEVESNSSQAFTITPNQRYSIIDVIIDQTSIGPVPEYTFTNVTSNHEIFAQFAKNPYYINSTATIGGTISPAGDIPVPNGENQTFSIVPNTGYSIENVLIDSVSVGPTTQYSFIDVQSNHTIQALFTQNTPEVDFTASPTTGEHPLNVQFTDISTGNPTAWSWTFGDGTSSNQQNPKHIYSKAGVYTVSLQATNREGSVTLTKSDYITVKTTVTKLPGQKNAPTDIDGDGKYEDLNGDGKFDLTDVGLYSRYYTTIQRNGQIAEFDYTGDGKIDYRDVLRIVQKYVIGTRIR